VFQDSVQRLSTGCYTDMIQKHALHCFALFCPSLRHETFFSTRFVTKCTNITRSYEVGYVTSETTEHIFVIYGATLKEEGPI
jgi:hypothetical protein